MPKLAHRSRNYYVDEGTPDEVTAELRAFLRLIDEAMANPSLLGMSVRRVVHNATFDDFLNFQLGNGENKMTLSVPAFKVDAATLREGQSRSLNAFYYLFLGHLPDAGKRVLRQRCPKMPRRYIAPIAPASIQGNHPSGYSVSAAGDINCDGMADIMIGLDALPQPNRNAKRTNQARVHVDNLDRWVNATLAAAQEDIAEGGAPANAQPPHRGRPHSPDLLFQFAPVADAATAASAQQDNDNDDAASAADTRGASLKR